MLATLETRTAARPPSDELAQLFESAHGRIYRVAFRITGSATDAEDVLQSVFIKLLDGRSLAELGNPESYLYRAAINAALDLCRSPERRARASLDAQPERAAPGGEPADVLALRTHLRAALARLTPRHAEMFVLRYLEGYDNREIAELTGTSQAVVAVTLFRVRGQLQKEFRQAAGGVR